MEHNLLKWINSIYKPNETISIEFIRKQAKVMSKFENFNASPGWFKNFLKRYNLRTKYKFI